MSARQCIYCGEAEAELRPYGPGGADVCMVCAFQTSEREVETRRQFTLQGGAAEAHAARTGEVVVIGEDCGPRPATTVEMMLAAAGGEGGEA